MKRFSYSLTALTLLALVTACGGTEETAPGPEAPASSAAAGAASSSSNSASPSASATPSTTASATTSASATPTPTPSHTVKKPTVTETNIPTTPAPTKPGNTRPTNAPNGTTASGEKAAGIPAGASELTPRELGENKQVATALSPTGNIGCEIFSKSAQCSVMSLSGQALKNAQTNGDTDGLRGWSYGVDTQGNVFDTKRAEAPLSVIDGEYKGQTIPYGTTVYYGQFTLKSEEDGMTLTDTESGHGAHYSRAGIQTF